MNRCGDRLRLGQPVLILMLFLTVCGVGSVVAQETIHRPDDRRPVHNDRKLAALGIHVYQSTHLKLYTDIDPQVARQLPALVDACYPAWEEYFGTLPPARNAAPFQITGYLIGDKALFQSAGLVPRDLPTFVNGRHRGQEFWMYEQEFDYYRRHLLLHEATHCFMTIMPNTRCPIWYLEGMAELFATHRMKQTTEATTDQLQIETGVMPENRNDYRGLGRITLVQNDLNSGKGRSIDQVRSLQAREFLKNEPYGWSWALCWFLDSDPSTRKSFRKLGQHLTDGQFEREYQLAFGRDESLDARWRLFVSSLEPGYDASAGSVRITKAVELEDGVSLQIRADSGWQPTGVRLRKGTSYVITASGRVTLADAPKPWISEPQGVTVRYRRGQPIGKLIAAVDETTSRGVRQIRRYAVGPAMTFTAVNDGVLYLRLNDFFGELDDNSGEVSVTISAVDPL